MPEHGQRVGTVVARASLALGFALQAGAAIWWAGGQDTRVSSLEAQFVAFRRLTPDYNQRLALAQRNIAVIEERIEHVVVQLDRMAVTLERIEGTR